MTLTLVVSSLLVGGVRLVVADRSTDDPARPRAGRRREPARPRRCDYADEQLTVYGQPFEPDAAGAPSQDIVTYLGRRRLAGRPAGRWWSLRPTTSSRASSRRTSRQVDTQPLITARPAPQVAATASRPPQIRTADARRRADRNTWSYGSPVQHQRSARSSSTTSSPLATEDAAANQIRHHRAGHRRRPGASCSGCSPRLVTRLVVDPGPGGRPHRPAALRRPARPADGGHRRGRPGAARRVVQPDGRQPAAADRAAGGDVPAAAAVHLRRLARAAHAADHGPDGRRPDLRRARASSTRRWPAAPSCCRPSWTGSRACSPTCWRSAGSTPASPMLDAEPTDLVPIVRPGGRAAAPAWPSGSACRSSVDVPADPVIAEVDPRRVERILRNLVGNAVEHGEGRPVVVTLAVRRARRSRSPSATTASGSSRARRSWSSTGSGGPTRRGPGRPAAPGSACRSASRTPGCTAAGWRRGARPARAPSSG